jgi:hypothetical protein
MSVKCDPKGRQRGIHKRFKKKIDHFNCCRLKFPTNGSLENQKRFMLCNELWLFIISRLAFKEPDLVGFKTDISRVPF